MALSPSGYLEPGSYQQEVVVPSGVAFNATQLALAIIGVGARTKRSIDEAIIRGQVADEPLTPGGGLTDTLTNRAIRRTSFINITKNGTPIPNTDWQFNPASLTTNSAEPFACNVNTMLTLALDGRAPVVIEFAAAGGTGALAVAVAVKPRSTVQFVATITNTVAVNLAALKAAEVAAAINAVLAYATDAVMGTGKGYGSTYSHVATTSSNKVVITSPTAGLGSDVVIYHGFENKDAGANALSMSNSGIVVAGESNALHAKTEIKLNVFDATATYLVDYVSPDSATDSVFQTGVQAVSKAGNFKGISGYKLGTDFTQVGDTLSWAGGAWTTAAVQAVAGPYNVSANKNLTISIDGKNAITMDLSGASLPPGGSAPAAPATATAAELAALINSYLAASVSYGPLYKGAAADAGNNTLKISSPFAGQVGIVEIALSSSADASNTVFGFTTDQLPYDVRGSGQKPVAGLTYFATYSYTRPSSDYNTPKRFYSADALYADQGNPSPDNPLSVAGQIAFKNNAPSIYIIQVDDATMTGSPSQLQVEAALAAADLAAITEVVVLDTRVATMTDLMSHVTEQCGPMIQHPRRAWMGLAVNTVGDNDTGSSYVYTASHSLQVPGDSPARGRFFLVAPGTGMTVPVTLDDGSEQDVDVDGNYVAVACAARYTARASVADAMVGQIITGFNPDSFPVYKPPERRLMASNGVLVIANEDGVLRMLDPLSTEQGGLAQFEEPSASSQKDAVTLAVNKAIVANLRGTVPNDLADFIVSIKLVIGGVLTGAIGSGSIAPYRNAAGATRELNYATDIQVFQNKSNPRKFTYKYWYNLRYPAKVFEGTYSVDNPFFNG